MVATHATALTALEKERAELVAQMRSLHADLELKKRLLGELDNKIDKLRRRMNLGAATPSAWLDIRGEGELASSAQVAELDVRQRRVCFINEVGDIL